MEGADGTQTVVPVITDIEPQNLPGDNPTAEGAVIIQGVITEQQHYISPDMAMQFQQEGAHIMKEESTGDNSAPLMEPLASSMLGTIIQSSGLETTSQATEDGGSTVDVRALPDDIPHTVVDLPGVVPVQIADSMTSAPGGQEADGDFCQEGVVSQSLADAGGEMIAATEQVPTQNNSEEHVIVKVHQVPAQELLSLMEEVQGSGEVKQQSEDADERMETDSEQPEDHTTDDKLAPAGDEASQQQRGQEGKEDSKDENKESKEVIFVCIHGQSFRCKPQAGIPVEAPKEEPSDACACSKSKKIQNSSPTVRKLRNRKQPFSCDRCGARFTQKVSLNLHMAAHEEDDERCEEGRQAGQIKTEDSSPKSKGGIVQRRTQQRKQEMENKSCPDCGKVFSRPKALSMHRKQHEKEKSKKCDDGETTKDNKVRNLSCTVCQKKFTRMYDVERHMETHVDGDRKKCGGCGKVFQTIKSRERHESLHCDMKKQNKCNTCHLVLASKYKLLRHEREHLTSKQIESLSCKDCSKVFTNPKSLLRHEKLHLKEKGALINCAHCPETFEDRFTYNIHRKTHAVKAYHCNLCGMKFKHEYLLKVHLKRMTCQKKRESLRDVECKLCHKVVKGTATLKRHMRTHTKEKPYPCRIGCNSSFSSTSNRLSHERMYCKLSPSYLCTHCGEVLSNQARLIYHESKFHGIGPIVGGRRTATTEFPCRHCGKVFFFKGGRKRHERIHTNDKPYMCQFCPKAFVHASALVCHERVHTKERPYTCKDCGKSFSQATHLKTHIRVHTKEKPYKCRICEKAFSHMGTRKSHEGTHKNNLPDPSMQAGVAAGQVTTKFHIPQQEHHVVVHPEIKVIHHDSEQVHVPHKIHVSHHEHEVQAADVILQLLESGSRVSNFEGLVHMASS